MNTLIDLIIKQEKQLFLRKDPISVLSDLIDDEFMEIGNGATIHDKAEVIRWLEATDQSEIQGIDFKAKSLSEDMILLTYISLTISPNSATPKQAMRSSLWRHSAGAWRIIFHQGTPITPLA